ncbi:CidA/LrgA family protein [Thermococcus gammatolerans]|uniref:Murein hydrolase exporter, putative lrgA-like protein (LrgA) n=1 Tax=Thermococcus gammatolerans (strain DSM 15229 / JCM 11827 / EJ3) TaxID=593117 RepID=C5A1Q2_THEGJ|nr:CidA/LrgA family protein [Thermococcus gammatolerans]ACS34321.1 Murein hydrolase exporter, putative lrgA-like protein (lrgA) [Thermococcus gammatolerans EJ3]
MRPYRGLTVIFGFYALGEIVSSGLHLPVPGSVLGMLFLLFALLSGAVKLEWVENEAEFLVKNMSVLFIPPGVGIILYLGLIRAQLVPVSVALVLSFVITLFVTAKTVEVLRR